MFKSCILLHAIIMLVSPLVSYSASDVVIATHKNYSKIIGVKRAVLLKYYAPVRFVRRT